MDYDELLAWADKAKTCVYLACEESVADDISAGINNLAAAIRELQTKLEAANQRINELDPYKRGVVKQADNF